MRRILIDAHVLLWAAMDSRRLSPVARDLLTNRTCELLFSSASAYEIAVKAAKGHLSLPDVADTFLVTRVAAFGLEPLAITVEHAAAAALLPPIHSDPWDRLLVAQARAESIPILTADTLLKRYEVEILW